MAPRNFPYRRLPGNLRGWIRKSSLWEGDDHLLLVRGTRFAEDYRRFYYRDIQAISMHRAPVLGSIGWLLLNLILCVLFVAVAVDSPRGWWIALPLTALLIANIVVSLRYGCRCHVQTAVSREELASLIRTWSARKTFARLRAKIDEAQGALPEDVSGLLAASQPVAAVSESAPAPEIADNSPSARLSVNLAILGFALFLVDAAQTYRLLDGPIPQAPTWTHVAGILLLLAEAAAIIGSLLAGMRVRGLKRLRLILLAALFFQGANVYLSYFLGSLYTLDKGVITMTTAASRWWRWLTEADMALLILFGILGLIFIMFNSARLRRGDPSAL
jgi:hypothetical protein